MADQTIYIPVIFRQLNQKSKINPSDIVALSDASGNILYKGTVQQLVLGSGVSYDSDNYKGVFLPNSALPLNPNNKPIWGDVSNDTGSTQTYTNFKDSAGNSLQLVTGKSGKFSYDGSSWSFVPGDKTLLDATLEVDQANIAALDASAGKFLNDKIELNALPNLNGTENIFDSSNMEQGSININTGANVAPGGEGYELTLRGTGRIYVQPSYTLTIVVPEGWRAGAGQWELPQSPITFIKYFNAQAGGLTLEGGYSYKITISKVDGTAVTPADLTDGFYSIIKFKINDVSDLSSQAAIVNGLFTQQKTVSYEELEPGTFTSDTGQPYPSDTAMRTPYIKVYPGQKLEYSINYSDETMYLFNSSLELVGKALDAGPTPASNISGTYIIPDGVSYVRAKTLVKELNPSLPDFYIKYTDANDQSIGEMGRLETINKSRNIHFSPSILAHRSLYGFAFVQENTIDAIKLAALAGFKKIECDVHITSDNQFVIMHDDSINRTMENIDGSAISGTVNIADKTLAELRSNYRSKSTDVKYKKPLPTLDEFLYTCKNFGIHPQIELKTLPEELDDQFVNTVLKYFALWEIDAFTCANRDIMTRLAIKYNLPLVTPIELIKSWESIGIYSTTSSIGWDSETLESDIALARGYGYEPAIKDITAVASTDIQKVFNEVICKYGTREYLGDSFAPEKMGGTNILDVKSDATFSQFILNGGVIADGILTLDSDESIEINPLTINLFSGIQGSFYTEGSFKFEIYRSGSVIETYTSTESKRSYISKLIKTAGEHRIVITAKAPGLRVFDFSVKVNEFQK